MDPSGKFFDSGPGRAHAMISGWEEFGAPVSAIMLCLFCRCFAWRLTQRYCLQAGMEIWVGEIAAAWHSGEPGVTNRFISSFWYADALGLLATINHTGFCRQSLIGTLSRTVYSNKTCVITMYWRHCKSTHPLYKIPR